MGVADAIELGKRAIYHATHRDAYSGGFVTVYHMKQSGWEFICREDVNDLHYKVFILIKSIKLRSNQN